MIFSYLYFLPFVSALISMCSVYICGLYLQKKAMAIGKKSPCEIEGVDQELENVMTQSLNNMVVAFKEQIPMISVMLSQAREDKLKSQAHVELVKAIPSIKKLMIDRLGKGEETSSLEQPVLFDSLAANFWKSCLPSALAISGLVGFVFGLVEMAFLL